MIMLSLIKTPPVQVGFTSRLLVILVRLPHKAFTKPIDDPGFYVFASRFLAKHTHSYLEVRLS
jgi:hypothetical protein